jgi:large subunit ribosomal protein L22
MAYAFPDYQPERMARAALKDAPVSFKKSIEVAKKLRGMMSDKAERYLEQVIALKAAVPYTRFVNGAGHRRGPMAAGKYPVKTAQHFLFLVKQGVANAENKDLGTPLKIIHIMAQPAATPPHHGRMRGHVTKRAHLELVLAETAESKRHEKKPKKEKAPKAEQKAAQQAEKPVADVSAPESVSEAQQAEKKVPKPRPKKADAKPEAEKKAPKAKPKKAETENHTE